MGGTLTADVHARAKEAFETYLAGIERGLAPDRAYLVGDGVTLADICFVAEVALFSNEKAQAGLLAEKGLAPAFPDGIESAYPKALAHFGKLSAHEAFAPDVQPYLESCGSGSKRRPDKGTGWNLCCKLVQNQDGETGGISDPRLIPGWYCSHSIQRRPQKTNISVPTPIRPSTRPNR